MKDTSTISIRIPKRMIEELRLVMEKEHFIDLSEAVRSIIRERWINEEKSTSSNNDIQEEKISELLGILKNKDILKKILHEN